MEASSPVAKLTNLGLSLIVMMDNLPISRVKRKKVDIFDEI